jgi:hypothetical protein
MPQPPEPQPTARRLPGRSVNLTRERTSIASSGYFRDGRCAIRLDGQWGIID